MVLLSCIVQLLYTSNEESVCAKCRWCRYNVQAVLHNTSWRTPSWSSKQFMMLFFRKRDNTVDPYCSSSISPQLWTWVPFSLNERIAFAREEGKMAPSLSLSAATLWLCHTLVAGHYRGSSLLATQACLLLERWTSTCLSGQFWDEWWVRWDRRSFTGYRHQHQ